MSELERKNGPSAVAETVTKDGRRIGTEVLFSAKDITKTFGGTQALKGVELEIHPGEIVGLVGGQVHPAEDHYRRPTPDLWYHELPRRPL